MADAGADILDRIRHARDRALEAEETERQRVADAENADVERAASVRLATRQAVREALDDVLGETSEPRRAVQGEGLTEPTGAGAGGQSGDEPEPEGPGAQGAGIGEG